MSFEFLLFIGYLRRSYIMHHFFLENVVVFSSRKISYSCRLGNSDSLLGHCARDAAILDILQSMLVHEIQ